MLFNTITYFIFLSIVFTLYWIASKKIGLQNLILLAASYFFYGYWSTSFLALLALSTILDFAYGFGVSSSKNIKAKLFLWLSIINNLGILAIFKYYNFFAAEFQGVASALGYNLSPSFLNIILPVGISFYTFHGMSYVFDIYYKKQTPITNVIDYAVFVSFFPLLVAGPIERAQHLLPQVQHKRTLNYTQLVQGCRLILWGLAKKVFVADTLAKIADQIFSAPGDYHSITLILGVIVFSFQIYADFSGYTDIALGSAKLLGFELLSNFRFPYFSRSIAEFWQRWHISLSSWFRDYVYFPLGGSRNGKWITLCNVLIVFMLSGIWHGANWTFLIWGLIHAIGFIPSVIKKSTNNSSTSRATFESRLPSRIDLLGMLFTFSFVSFAWIFFRANSISDALLYIKLIFQNFGGNCSDVVAELQPMYESSVIVLLLLVDWYLRKDERNLKVPASTIIRWTIYITLGVLILLNMSSKVNFIYFQF